MVMSMTGFGRSVKQTTDHVLQVEIKTVNQRYREYHIKVPQPLSHTETSLRHQLSTYFNRGRVEVNVKLSGNSTQGGQLHIDWALMDSYYRFIKETKSRYQLPDEPALSDLLQFTGNVCIEQVGDIDGELASLLASAVDEAAEQVLKMRETEGASLSGELDLYINTLEELVIKTKELVPLVQRIYTEKVKKRIDELVQENIDESRLAIEAAIFADKADIGEELARLASHIYQFQETLRSKDPIGRKLDFIIQEMNREVNTIGSKANDSDIAGTAVEMKVLIEKLREQIQNIE